ncbi:hypothetical protein [Novosphingobium mangrovi (ex Huang et al. 2023)]|uniref:Gluconate 2-dehydrogenase subunit 3 family protein n=1 Tax=Novosphingobium mangrovi (ex Huang et al. 2023) TaxID=2976432 RepID=A0ABT2I6I1_9SPHN|nr:hypothetical protein [Novosphingobium mangrovi (ex Huang et al. 2023)]MCT2400427.1 hypothetical protein [Novosphingobium mangrovi (ex Huang et al. 2023)]
MPESDFTDPFDLDIELRDAALDEANSPTRRMIANACLGMEMFDAFYATRELRELVDLVLAEDPRGKPRLATVLSTTCDDFQRCLYFCLAGRGAKQMADDLAWLQAMLDNRLLAGYYRGLNGIRLVTEPVPYVAPKPDGPLVSPDAGFELGPSWRVEQRH